VPESKFTVVRLILENNKFEILVKPDPALEYKLGKRHDLSNVLVSDEIYTDANKGLRAGSEKLSKYFKTSDSIEVAKQILLRGEHSLTTEQRRRMIEEKKKQIVQYISKNFVDPRTHLPHPPLRITSAMNEVRTVIDPYKKAEDQAKNVIDAIRKILPLKSENLLLTIIVPSSYAAQSYSVLKTVGGLKGEQWLADGSLKILLETNAGMKGDLVDRIGSITKGTASITEQK
jgi:ribosome maturation protein SDO1